MNLQKLFKGVMRRQFCGLRRSVSHTPRFARPLARTTLSRGTALFLVTLSTLWCAAAAPGQCEPHWVSMHGSGSFSGPVYAMATTPEGDLIAGGSFSLAGGVTANQIARYSASEQAWFPLGSGVNGRVKAVARAPDGQIYVGGSFTQAGGSPASYIARYNPTTNVWAPLGGGVGLEVDAITLLHDGTVIVGGLFTSAGGRSANHIARFDPDTGEWSALGTGASNQVKALATAPDGSVIVGGFFASAGGIQVGSIARYDPTSQQWSSLGGGVDQTVNAIAFSHEGNIIAAGTFVHAGGVAVGRVASYDPRSGLWSTLGSGVDGTVNSLITLPGDNVVATGAFTHAGGAPAAHVARCNLVTGAWTPLNVGSNDVGYALSSGIDGNFYIGGDLSRNSHAVGVLAYSAASSSYASLSAGLDGPVKAFLSVADEDFLVGGSFTSAGGAPASAIARLRLSTGTWYPVGSGVDGTVNALAMAGNGDIAVGGQFVRAGGQEATEFARYRPSIQSWLPFPDRLANVINGYVQCLATLPNGNVQLGGFFSTIGQGNAPALGTYDPYYNRLLPFATGPGEFGAIVHAMVALPNADLVIGGDFASVGGVPANDIARYSIAAGQWTTLGSGPSGPTFNEVDALLKLSNGDVIVGGSFIYFSGVEAHGIARYQPTSGAWSALGTGVNGVVRAIAELPEGDLIVGGTFNQAGTGLTNNIARFSPSSSIWSNLGQGVDGTVRAIAVLPSGDLLVGGDFARAGGQASSFISRYAFGEPPRIRYSPANQSVCEGSHATFATVASGAGNLMYQWRRDGSDINAASNPSASTATLMLSDVRITDAGVIDCVVSNTCGSVETSPASFAVFPSYSRTCGGPGCLADLNSDGCDDLNDVDYLINVVAGGDNPTHIDPDFNVDGNVDQNDVDTLLNVVTGGPCP